MATSNTTQTSIAQRPPLVQNRVQDPAVQSQAEERGLWQGLIYEIKLAFFTITFVLFCVVAVAFAVFISHWFANGSYKAVVFFLDIILISNVAGKYVIWILKPKP